MKRFTFPLLALAVAFSASAEISLPEETLQYDVCYHCGFIKISAGEADVNLTLDNNNFTATMNGQTEPIGDRVYAISDTLCATMLPTNGLSKEVVSYENGWYTKPKADTIDGSVIEFSNPTDYKNINGNGDLSTSSETMEAVTISTDMLGLFYYFQQIDFTAMKPGESIDMAITLPDGDEQQVNIVYEGLDNYNGSDTYRLKFAYSYHGVMSNYPVTAQIDMNSRLPLLFSADLKIGRVELILKS